VGGGELILVLKKRGNAAGGITELLENPRLSGPVPQICEELSPGTGKNCTHQNSHCERWGHGNR
jgi:hypothetical protein